MLQKRRADEKIGAIRRRFIKFLERIFSRYEFLAKKIRNRIPDNVVYFGQKIFPYLAIFIVAFFTIAADIVKAAESNVEYVPSEEVMDLSPVEIANVVNNVSSYVPNVQQDSIEVMLVMQNQNYLGKPIITETAQTQMPQAAPDNRQTTVGYTVQAGDTLSTIGWIYGLKIATIKYTNNLESDIIRPGQILKLPPGDVSPSVIKKALAASAAEKKVASAKTVNRAPGSRNNAYPYGWCTYYVASRRYVPGGWGNAGSWLASARASGYATGSAPAVGAIVVTSESWVGHVAYVEGISGSSIVISEMNYRGWGIVNRRALSAYGGVVRGYIY